MEVKNRFGVCRIHESSLGGILDLLDGESAFAITDQNIANNFPSVRQERTLVLPPGEETKQFASFQKAVEWLAEKKAKRTSRVMAIGGGVIGDLAGFAASAYMRGIGLTGIPTTLLAMVDSSVGGKVGIDLPAGKNLVGAFYPASEVILCFEFLKTLPRRQILNGCAEVLKYGFIMRPEILSKAKTALQDGNWNETVYAGIQCKKEVVEADELETTGLRAILNFGHTVGHAVESVLDYKGLLHGEAISVGMIVEAALGEDLGITKSGTMKSVRDTLKEAGLPASHPALANPAGLIQKMKLDKKADKSLAMSLLTEIGDCRLVRDIPESAVESACSKVLSLAS